MSCTVIVQHSHLDDTERWLRGPLSYLAECADLAAQGLPPSRFSEGVGCAGVKQQRPELEHDENTGVEVWRKARIGGNTVPHRNPVEDELVRHYGTMAILCDFSSAALMTTAVDGE